MIIYPHLYRAMKLSGEAILESDWNLVGTLVKHGDLAFFHNGIQTHS